MIIHAVYFLIITGSAAMLTYGGVLLTRAVFRHASLLGVNAPARNAGLAVAGALVAFLLVSGASGEIAFGICLLAVISFIDERGGVEERWRMLAQGAAVVLCVTLIKGSVTQGMLPPWADAFIAMAIWLGLLNLNTALGKGGEGTAGSALVLGVGLVAMYIALPFIIHTHLPRGLLIDGAVLASIAIGFLYHNRGPERLPLGGPGAIALGFMSGFLLLQLAASGQWIAALLLALLSFASGSLTSLSARPAAPLPVTPRPARTGMKLDY